MKKYLLIAFGLILSGAFVWAASTSSVSSIPEKATGEAVSYMEFNQLVGTLKGIFNTCDDVACTNHRFGLNGAPMDDITLDIDGAIKVEGDYSAADCDANFSGVVYFGENPLIVGEDHFWMCNGTEWKKLDADNCDICNGSTPSTNNDYLCQNDGTWSNEGTTCNTLNYDDSGATIYSTNNTVCSNAAPEDGYCTPYQMYKCDISLAGIGSWIDGGGACITNNYDPSGSTLYAETEIVCSLSSPDPSHCALEKYTCVDPISGGIWEPSGVSCSPSDYDNTGTTVYSTGYISAPPSSICTNVVPNDSYCHPAGISYRCNDSGIWTTSGVTCAPIDYDENASTYYQSGTFACADPSVTPEDEWCLEL